jgi:hypothetical protein
MKQQDLFINQRIQLIPSPHNKGTIRYIGIVPKQSPNQTWVGIEWDDVQKGKNNGTIENQQLFTTYANRNSASFVKIDKLIQVLSDTKSFSEALTERYISSVDEPMEETMFGSKKVEIVGADDVANKLSKVDTLHKIGLTERKVSSVDQISTLCPSKLFNLWIVDC